MTFGRELVVLHTMPFILGKVLVPNSRQWGGSNKDSLRVNLYWHAKRSYIEFDPQ